MEAVGVSAVVGASGAFGALGIVGASGAFGSLGIVGTTGAFGAHVPIEAAVTIGMYPDLPRDRLISAGNTSLEGAQRILLNRESLSEMDAILEKMVYVQFSEVGDFVSRMVAAQALPQLLRRTTQVQRS